MTDEEDRNDVRDRLSRYCPIETTPDITDLLDEIIDNAQRAQRWAASTAFEAGDVMQPTVRNGHRYRCIVGGTSDAAEPVWGTTPRNGSRLTEAGGVEWEECGPDAKSVYDLRAAIYGAWMAKASLAHDYVNHQVGQDRADEAQIYQHCVEMASKYVPVRIG